MESKVMNATNTAWRRLTWLITITIPNNSVSFPNRAIELYDRHIENGATSSIALEHVARMACHGSRKNAQEVLDEVYKKYPSSTKTRLLAVCGIIVFIALAFLLPGNIEKLIPDIKPEFINFLEIGSIGVATLLSGYFWYLD